MRSQPEILQGAIRRPFAFCSLPQVVREVYYCLYNAFEYSLDEQVKSLEVYMSKIPDPAKLNFGSVMELAIIDRDNPFSWGLLAHEFGHYLDDKHHISAPVATQFLQNQFLDDCSV